MITKIAWFIIGFILAVSFIYWLMYYRFTHNENFLEELKKSFTHEV